MIEKFIAKHYETYISLKNINRKKVIQKEIPVAFNKVLQGYFSDSEEIKFKKIEQEQTKVLLSSIYADNTKELLQLLKNNEINTETTQTKIVTYQSKNHFYHVLISKQNNSSKIYCQGKEKI
ncbi:hypothetical protein KO361_05510 [Candidatus Woesearchaeota archaeon]|nr:hypothetical protein [Candidatus Woesearchaeota archaeon]